MAWAPIVAAGVQAGGSLLGGMLGASGQAAANAQQFQQSEMLFGQQQTANQHFLDQQQGYNTLMSNTAYQRSMEDMRLAGLNPILAAGGNVTNIGSGGSASVGGGSIAPLGNPGAALGAGISSAAQAGQRYAEYKAMTAQADKDGSATDLNKASEKLVEKQGVKTDQETATSKSAETLNDATTLNKVAENALMRANASSANAIARVNTRIAEDTERFGDSTISKTVGALLRMLGTGSRMVGVTPNSATSPAPPRDMRPGVPGSPVFGPTTKWNTP